MPYPREGLASGRGQEDFYACSICEKAGRTSYELCSNCEGSHCTECRQLGRCVAQFSEKELKELSKSEAERQRDIDEQLKELDPDKKEGSIALIGYYLKRFRSKK